MQESSKNQIKKLIKTIGLVIEEHRHRQGKSAYRISAECALSKTSWREVELGSKNPRISTLWKMAEGLDIPLGDLLNEVKQKLGQDFSLSDME